MFNWEDLRYFHAVAQGGSLSAAARLLQVDHATVGRRVTSLEQQLAGRLLDRQARACVLTPLGEQVLQLTRAIEHHAFAIERAADAERAPARGKVTLSVPPVLVNTLLTRCMFDFRQRYPEIQLTVVSQPGVVSLTRREADLALRLVRPTDDHDVARKLGVMPFSLYAHNDYRYLNDPARWEFIGYEEQLARMPHAKWINEMAGQRPISCAVSDIISQHQAAKAGLGVASLPQFIGDSDRELQRLPYTEAGFSPEVWLVVHADLRASPLLRKVMDFITTAVKTALNC